MGHPDTNNPSQLSKQSIEELHAKDKSEFDLFVIYDAMNTYFV